ncbi:hypothetical protein AOL_s00210g190 [Orbilia oligospora ATCC 24927]|uniref:BTB domain-containing protein n=1 Tax=Arthrobotrys oligospora (strain ATCC 24927 / CBS 115.81 / DSM 1491) TaxID=756982 RepID=G1XS32_ARTOA|nr:hypothetical protein AOL_s00210g190 [Orbilia oligospora ATCC 24927]EGX44029.1 hypothetical protein AOL_s00210g190 [Orbilia oligospora ATCC 24927]
MPAPQNLPNSWNSIPPRTPSRSDVDSNSIIAEETASDPSTSGLSTPQRPDFGTSDNPANTSGASINLTNATIFTEDYDLIIIVRSPTDQRTFIYLVSKDILSVSSSVLRPIIRVLPTPNGVLGAIATARGLKKLYIDGDPEALRVIFRILHFDADESCRDIEFNTLCQIAILADKYQWQMALQTWSEIWLLLWEKFALDPGYENWLYISKVFNSLNEVEKLVELLGKECSALGVEGFQPYRINGGQSQYLNTELWSVDLITPRKDQTTMFKLVPTFSAFGSLTRSIAKARLTATSRLITDWNKSAVELESKLKSLQFVTLEAVVPEHKCALQGFKSGFARYIADPESTLGGRMRRIFGDIVVYENDRVHISDGL